METRDGLIEFRVNVVEVPHGRKVRIKEVLEYRQCFKGVWQAWQPVPVVSGGGDR